MHPMLVPPSLKVNGRNLNLLEMLNSWLRREELETEFSDSDQRCVVITSTCSGEVFLDR